MFGVGPLPQFRSRAGPPSHVPSPFKFGRPGPPALPPAALLSDSGPAAGSPARSVKKFSMPKHKMNRIVAPILDENNIPNLHCIFGQGLGYRGYENKTIDGTICDKWKEEYPPYHGQNYCRNPDGQEKPWCFSKDSELGFQQCNISQCVKSESVERDLHDHHGLTYKGEANVGLSGRYCSQSIKKHFLLLNCLDGNGSTYAGTISTTKTGKRCRNWSLGDQKRSLKYGELFGPKVRNFCRNPDNSETPWCFVGKDGTQREDCHIPLCNPHNVETMQVSRENVCSRFVHDLKEAPWCFVDDKVAEPCLFPERELSMQH